MNKLSVLLVLLSMLAFSSCEKDDDDKILENQLIGNWKYQDASNNYWYQLSFQSDLTGTRTDADGENTQFVYEFTSSELNFTAGFPKGEYNYSISGDKLSLFGDILIKQ